MTSYVGGKSRLGRRIAASILHSTTPDFHTYIEPFVGMAGVLRHIVSQAPPTLRRVCMSDYDEELIAMWTALIFDDWQPPSNVTKEEFNTLRSDPTLGTPALRAFVKYGCAFGGLIWSCWAPTSERSARSVLNVARILQEAKESQGIEFLMHSGDYREIPTSWLDDGAVLYCDPPYEQAIPYRRCPRFCHDDFWRWVDEMPSNVNVFVSESSEPHAFVQHKWDLVMSHPAPITGFGKGATRHRNRPRMEHVWRRV